MTRKPNFVRFSLFLLVILSLLMSACGATATAPAPMSLPATATAIPATATSVPTIAPTVAPTVALATVLPTTAPTKSATTAAANSSPVELVRRINLSSIISNPGGLVFDHQGNMYLNDYKYSVIYKLDANFNLITKWGRGGRGDGEFIFEMGQVGANKGGTIIVDSQNNVYVGDRYNQRVQKFDSNGKFLTKWGSKGTADGQFLEAGNLLIDNLDNIYVVEDGRVQKFDTNGKFLGKLDSASTGDEDFKDLLVAMVDSQGTSFYAANNKTVQIHKLNSDGKTVAKFGSSGQADGQFAEIGAMALDSKGNLYVAEGESNRITIFNSSNKFVANWIPKDVGLSYTFVRSLAIDSKDNIYISDVVTRTVYQFRLRGTTGSTTAGDNSTLSFKVIHNDGWLEYDKH